MTLFSDDEDGTKKIVAFGGGLLENSTDGIAIVEGRIIGTGGAIQFAGIGEGGGCGVTIGGEERNATETRFFRGTDEASEFRLGDGQRRRSGGGELVFVDELIAEAGDANGVIGRLAAYYEQMGIVGCGFLIIAAIAATSAETAALGKERDETQVVACGVRSIECGDVIDQRGFSVDRFRDGIFGVAAEDDMFLAVFCDDRCRTDLEVGHGRIGASIFRGGEGAENLRVQDGIGHESFRLRGEMPRGGIGSRVASARNG